MLGVFFAVALPLLAADVGADPAPTPPGAPTPAAPALIPQPGDRFADRVDKIDLREAKDGSGDLVYEATSFTARIARDGTVTFAEKRLTGLSAWPILPSRTTYAVPSLQSSLKMLLQGKKAKAPPVDDRRPPPETTSVIPQVSRYLADPREGCRNCSQDYPPALVSAFGRFDVADEMERFSGKDPNRYQKAVFLASTHDRRMEMAVRTHVDYVRRASAELPARLQLIACDPRLTPGERRAILVALGREMDTATPEGAAAAARIKTFVSRYEAGEISCTAATKLP